MSRKKYLSILWIVGGVCSMHAASDSGPGFEIQNKGVKNIWIGLMNGQKPVKRIPELVEPGGRHELPIEISANTKLFVWRLDNPATSELWLGKDPDITNYDDVLRIINSKDSVKPEQYKKAEGIRKAVEKAERAVAGKIDAWFDVRSLADYVYDFTPDKTIYLTWESNKARPQTGKLKGLAGKTETGYSLKHNVKEEDIKKER